MPLKIKKANADATKDARRLDDKGVQIMNLLEGYGNDNTRTYNKNVFKPYLEKRLVDTSGGGFVKPEFISNDFITAQDVEPLLKKKFQTNAVVKKSDTDLNDMIEVATNVINKVKNPTQTLNTLAKAPANNKIISEFSQITNKLDNNQLNDIKMENDTFSEMPATSFLGGPLPSLNNNLLNPINP
jgi:hypothetical protein